MIPTIPERKLSSLSDLVGSHHDGKPSSFLSMESISLQQDKLRTGKDIRTNLQGGYSNRQTRKQTCKQSNRKVKDWSQLRCNSNSNRLKFFKCNSNSNRLKFYLLHLLLSIIFLLQFTLCYFSEGGCRKMIT